MERHGLEVFDVSQNNINGGSFRTYIRFKGAPVGNMEGRTRVDDMRFQEKYLELDKESTYRAFGGRASLLASSIGKFVRDEVEKGKQIIVYGASTRGNVLLQACGLDNRWLSAAAERNPDKWGKTTSGTNIPIISEEEARKAKPDYFLVLPWHFRDEFIQREQEYLNQGGRLIFPLPEFSIVEK